MHRRSVAKPIIVATLVCGSLDIVFAVILTMTRGKDPAAMLRFVASGPLPAATGMGTAGSLLGLLVHFGLMAMMAAFFVFFVATAGSQRQLIHTPWRAGVAYGAITYAVMNLIILPLRFPAAWPPKPFAIGTQLFAHIVLVGWPMALIARHYLYGRS